MSNNLISEARVRKQAFYYYLVLVLWPVYLFILPAVFVYGGWWVLIYLIFPGLYLFTWLGFLMHESWHKFVPTVNNRFFYNAFAFMILSDPQLYFIVHGWHHSQVHTYQDAEFHPLGEIKSRFLRLLNNWFEVIFGVAFIVGMASLIVPRDLRFARKYRYWKSPISIGVWAIFLGVTGYLSHLTFNVTLSQVLLSFGLIYWVGSFFLHQSQLIEHGNLIIEGAFSQRNIKTRNLQPKGLIEKTFLFLTHNDSREHVLHHTQTSVHSRPFPGTINLPEKAVFITMSDYCRILGRMLAGKVDQEIVTQSEIT